MRASQPRRGFLLPALIFALASALALPSIAAVGPLDGVPLRVPTIAGFGWLSQVWSWLGAIWPDAGCGSDPDGQHCTAGAIRMRPQEGCGSDLDGRHCTAGAPLVRPQAGLGSDPNGLNGAVGAVSAGRTTRVPH
jgi:hypothetical protein